jgi:adenine-specific DNA-methyltransferase
MSNVKNYRHDKAKRRNIPTAEQQGFVEEQETRPKRLRYKRNPDLDPQLVWRGKDEEDGRQLTVDAPPVYIQEKIHPRQIIERLRTETRARAAQGSDTLDLFHDFNGLPDIEARTEFYAHDQNWSNRMILGDALLVMASLAERENLRGKVQMIYLDPPYGIKFNSNWQVSTASRDVKDGNAAHVSREPEVVRAFRDTWKDGINTYLSYLRDRLVLSRDLLADTGAIFVQIGDENVHVVRSLLDEIFGPENFVALIPVQKSGGSTGIHLAGVADYILFFARDVAKLKYRQMYKLKQLGGDGADKYNRLRLDDLSKRLMTSPEADGSISIPAGARVYSQDNLTSQSVGRDKGEGAASWFGVRISGREIKPSEKVRWKTNQSGMARLLKADRVELTGDSIRFMRFLEDFPAIAANNWWDDIGGIQSRTAPKVYVVQTPTRMVERCLLMTTDPGDLVLDPTCGSGTTAYVAEQWGRRWITIDTSRVALALARARLMGGRFPYYLLRDSKDGAAKEAELLGRPPADDIKHGCDVRQGFVYERVPHITLKSIAQNSEIDIIWDQHQLTLEPMRASLNKALRKSWEEWEIPREADDKWSTEAKDLHSRWWTGRRARQAEIDKSIADKAEFETLYDRPYEGKNVVRVTGPFTVESLSPHRVLPSDDDESILDAVRDEDGALPRRVLLKHETGFEQVVIEQLKVAGFANRKKGENVKFEGSPEPWPGQGWVSYAGRYLEVGAVRRAAIAIGPEYGTVGYEFVRAAGREAMDAFDVLLVCGFSFAPEVDETRLNFGRLRVIKLRMDQDVRQGMSEKLKKVKADSLFIVYGEPEIAVRESKGGLIEVEIKGVDIFDPSTGQVRSSASPEEDIAAWFVDDDYDAESFFVRQAYFLDGRQSDPYAALKRALKAEIDEEAWGQLRSTVTRPFPRPKSGRICVKVINHYGDEVQKVFRV